VPDSRLNKQAARSGRAAAGGGSKTEGGGIRRKGKWLWELGCIDGKFWGEVPLDSPENLEQNARKGLDRKCGTDTVWRLVGGLFSLLFSPHLLFWGSFLIIRAKARV
jgi:hypothetical protein